MERNVIKSRTYAVSCANACTVKTADGVLLCSVSAGVQIQFVAVTDSVVISDDSAICELSFNSAPASSASGGGGTTWVNTLLEESLYTDEEFTQFSGESESNAAFTTMTLDARYIPAGKLQSLDILCRTDASSAFSPEPVYLHIWQENAVGEFVKIGTSTNMMTQVTGTVQEWEFDDLEIQSASTKIMASANANDGWENQINMGAQCFARDEDDSISLLDLSELTTMTCVPVMNIRVLQAVERYTSQASFNDHAEDSYIHITDEERSTWNSKADSSSLSTKVNSSTFTAHTGDDVAHLSSDEHTALTSLITGGGSSSSSQCIIYDYSDDDIRMPVGGTAVCLCEILSPSTLNLQIGLDAKEIGVGFLSLYSLEYKEIYFNTGSAATSKIFSIEPNCVYLFQVCQPYSGIDLMVGLIAQYNFHS